jgi:hypothetical protein
MNLLQLHTVKNIREIFSGKRLYYHLLAICLTILIVESGLDWKYFLFAQSSGLYGFFRPALGIGFFVPVFLPLLLLLVGLVLRKKVIRIYGWLLLEAATLGWIISSTYKAFTGRVQPNIHDMLTDSSHSFHFGFMEHGIFWGWPSSHTTVAFAMSYALVSYLDKRFLALRYFITSCIIRI